MPETINRWYYQEMHLDRQWQQVKKEVEYHSKMTMMAKVQLRDNQGW
jgi:hypothetical protein